MNEKQAKRRALRRLQTDHIQSLADEIARPRPKKQRPAAWSIAAEGMNPKEVALAVLVSAVQHRPEDGKHPPSVLTVALSIAKTLHAEDTFRKRLGTAQPVPTKKLVDVGVGLLHFAVQAGLIQPIQGPEAKERDGKRATPRVLLTEAAHERLGEYYAQAVTFGLAREMFPLAEAPDPTLDPVQIKKNWRGMIDPPAPPQSYLPALELIRRTPWQVNECIYKSMHARLPDAQLRYAYKLAQNEGWRSLCKHKDRVIALQVADSFRGRRFWLDVTQDYRGRIYHGGALRFNGADNALRPLLEFADGQVLTDEGAKYLAAYVAAQWQPKVSATEVLKQRRAFLESRSGFWGTEISRIDDLERWTLANEDLLLRVASDPEKRDEWWQLDEDVRWYALAAADAWKRYRDGLPVHLPCSWDAVASGLQVYALLMRDEALASKVALTFASVGAFYDEIADECPGETRTTAKAVVMPWFYGSEEPTSALALAKEDNWAAAGPAALVSRDAPEAAQKAAKAARKAAWPQYVKRAQLLREKAEEKAQALVHVRDWLQKDVAPVFFSLRQEICWVTPGGFEVVQDNHLCPAERIWTEVEGGRMSWTQRRPKGGLDPVKQTNSLPANVIHSLDATWLMATVLRGANAGIKSWGTVHDCFAVHPNDAGKVSEAYTSAAEDVFGDDYLAELHRQFQEQTRDEASGVMVEIKPPPQHDSYLPLALTGGREHLMPSG